jgi:hypothetical protein
LGKRGGCKLVSGSADGGKEEKQKGEEREEEEKRRGKGRGEKLDKSVKTVSFFVWSLRRVGVGSLGPKLREHGEYPAGTRDRQPAPAGGRVLARYSLRENW